MEGDTQSMIGLKPIKKQDTISSISQANTDTFPFMSETNFAKDLTHKRIIVGMLFCLLCLRHTFT